MSPSDKLNRLAGFRGGKLIIGTHPHKFHLDEVTAIALAKRHFKGPMEVVRSRDWNDLKDCQIVVDVGNKNEVANDHVYFDHHEALDKRKTYKNGVKYAACGKFADWLYEDDGYTSWYDFLLHDYLYTVQAIDNGQAYKNLDLCPPIFQITPLMNPTVIETSSDEGLQMQLFNQTVDMVTTLIDRIHAKYTTIRNTKFLFENDIVGYKGDGILVLSNPPDMALISQYNSIVDKTRLIKLVVFPDFSFAKYKVHTISSDDISNEPYLRLPKAWRGLKGKDLSSKSKIENGYIVSANGFFGTWKTLENALQAAKKAVKAGEID